jgi:hypothetical protein
VVVHVSSIKEVKKQNSALSMLSIHTTDGDKVGKKPTMALIVFV